MGDLDQVHKLVAAYRPAADFLTAEGAPLLSSFEQAAANARAAAFVSAGAPRHLAETVAMLRPLTATTDGADLARAGRWGVRATARLYHAVGEAFGFERLRPFAGAILLSVRPSGH